MLDLTRYQRVDADKISGGLLPVLRNGRVGYVNMQGREVIPAMYDMLKEGQSWARPVSEGRIVVKQNGHYGVVDTANKTVIPFSAAINDIDDYRSGMTRVRKIKPSAGWIKTANLPLTQIARLLVKIRKVHLLAAMKLRKSCHRPVVLPPCSHGNKTANGVLLMIIMCL